MYVVEAGKKTGRILDEQVVEAVVISSLGVHSFMMIELR